jgi:gluconolactonase
MALELTSSFEVVDRRFRKLALPYIHVEKLYTGCRWAEGPAWFAAGRYLVWSDIPNDRMLRWDETDGSVSVFRQPSMNSNGHTVDLQGRLVSCEHLSRCVSRTEFDGKCTVLADLRRRCVAQRDRRQQRLPHRPRERPRHDRSIGFRSAQRAGVLSR